MWNRKRTGGIRGWVLLLAGVVVAPLKAQMAEVLPQVNLRRYGVPPADYSGITGIGADRYALVSDKEVGEGYYPLLLRLDSLTGRVTALEIGPFRTAPLPVSDGARRTRRDAEGVAYYPAANTLFISGEADQEIHEYEWNGRPTGRQLAVPERFARTAIWPNYGFEALTFDAARNRFWTTTENVLRADGEAVSPRNPQAGLLRLQSFGADLQPAECYAYRMDAPAATRTGRAYACGVSALTALPDGTLLVLEREFYVAKRYWGSWVQVKIYRIRPTDGQPLSAADAEAAVALRKALPKQLVAAWKSRFSPVNTRLANYEGMCLGPRLADGRQTVVLVSDSQSGAGRAPYRLKDFLRVLVLPAVEE